MSGVYSVQLSSTPPLSLPTPSPASRSTGGKRGSTLVSFRSGLSEHEVGSLKGSLSRSLTTESSNYSRSFGARRSTPVEGNGFNVVASATASASSAARPLCATTSIPKSAQFVKIEGFETTRDSTPTTSAPTSPQTQRSLSLLSRQLSTDRLPSLTSPSILGLSMPAASPSLLSPQPVGLDDPLSGLAARLEEAVRVTPPAPLPRPPLMPRARPSVPDNLLEQLQHAHAVFREPVCVRAFQISRAAHDGRHRASGEPALLHCVEVARVLAEMGAGEQTVAAALLHDVLNKTQLVEGQLRPMLRDDGVAELVKQVGHLGDISSRYRACPATSTEGQASTASRLVSMLVAMGCNHALLVKLADRLHDMRTLGALPAAKRNRLARETIDVWAPLANRLGVWSLKAQLEDLAFRQLYPAQYSELRARLEAVQSADVLVGLMDSMRAELQQQGISYHDLSGRPKHLWGVWKKMAAKGYPLGRVSDVRGLRIIVDSKADCYRALRAVESVWKPVGPTKDYIRRPKENGYRSIHTVVRGEDGHDIEVQIRTAKMHYFAEYGADAAHWQYKERNYGTAAAAASTSPSDEADAGATVAGAAMALAGASGAAREANWAKFVLSQQVRDQKYRPSGSPTQDTSLASIVGLAAATTSSQAGGESSSSGEASPEGSPPKDARFAAYLERSGQALAPPAEERVVVAVVHGGGLAIEELPRGSTLAQLLGARALSPHSTQVLVNKQLEGGTATVLRTGDIVDLYTEQAGTAPAVVPLHALPSPQSVFANAVLQQPQAVRQVPIGAGRSNVVPLGALNAARLRATEAN